MSEMNQIYFTGDLHFGHSSILKHARKRPYSDMVDIVEHDAWLLEKLPGRKFFIEGNHDGSISAYRNYFKGFYQIKEMRFKPTMAPFLKEDFNVVMCHYPMVTWNHKSSGAVMLHGHCYGKLDDFNAQSTDLRFDVGLDGSLANLKILTLEDIYNAATEKITQSNCSSFAEYAMNNYREEVR